MTCTCDAIGESPCREHGFGLLECECGMRFTAPLHPKSFQYVMCPACGQGYSGQEENCGPGCWKKEGTGGTMYKKEDYLGKCYIITTMFGTYKECVIGIVIPKLGILSDKQCYVLQQDLSRYGTTRDPDLDIVLCPVFSYNTLKNGPNGPLRYEITLDQFKDENYWGEAK